MGVVQLRQIRNHIESIYGPSFDISDCSSRSVEDVKNILLSRCLAAFAISIDTEISPKKAAAAIVDGFDDNGIDAIYFSAADRTLYLCQSKWSHDGTAIIDLGSAMKFIKGVQDLLKPNFANFGLPVQRRRAELDAAVNATSRIVMIVAASGSGAMADHPRRALEDLLATLNDTGEVAILKIFNQEALHSVISQGGQSDLVDFDVQLFDWGATKSPYQAFYGQVAASDVASWGLRFRSRLFASNIRSFLGDSTLVNEGIAKSLRTNPAHFWYLNNGITALCRSIRRLPVGGATRDVGTFECEGVSIVNGAQTVGVITGLAGTNDTELAQARVPIRFISLQDCPSGFGMEVTKATNTRTGWTSAILSLWTSSRSV